VLGRRLGMGEMRRMAIIENITTWFRERQAFLDWGEYAKQHPNEAAVLTEAHRLAVAEGLMAD
jgi:hypothetical protein